MSGRKQKAGHEPGGVHEARQKMLRRLAEEIGSQAALARLIRRQPDYVSGVISGRRNLGELLAREIERRTGKPRFWLDGNVDGTVESELPIASLLPAVHDLRDAAKEVTAIAERVIAVIESALS